ncbi:MAG TPA: hypothetical protein DEB31_10045, partial [Clostridiales bacterium]|nr:hypothetical protein [Clostridiales bacterium]
MKKTVSYLLVILLAVTLAVSMGGAAFAATGADSISTSVKISPASLTGAGTVNVTVTVTNTGPPISNVVLKYPSPTDTEVPLDAMATGETKERVDANWAISEDMLGRELKFMVYWTSQDGTQKSGSTQGFTIARQQSNLNVTGSASASAQQIKKGDKVKFNFSIKNAGNVRVDTGYLNAPPIEGGAQIGETFSLDPGSEKKMEYTVTVNESMNVQPVVTYTAAGQQYTLPLDTLGITVDASSQQGSFTVKASVNKSQVTQGGTVQFNLRVDNTGPSQLTGLAVKDFAGNTVPVSPTSLAPGEYATGLTELPVTASGSYSFRVTASDAAGNNLSATSNAVDITVDGDPAASPSGQPTSDTSKMLKLNMSLPTENIPVPTDITARIEVTNQSEQDISNIVVSAVDGDTAKTLSTLASLAAGQSNQMQGTIHLTEDVNYVFTVTGQLPDGTLVESSTASVPITTVPAEPEGISSALLGVIIILIAIAAVAVFLGIYLARQRKKNRERAAERTKNAQSGQQVSPSGRVRPPSMSAARRPAPDDEEGRP